MIKYVPIDAVLNYVPDAIKEQVDTTQMLSWAHLTYRTMSLQLFEELKVVDITVKDHRAKLPDDVSRILSVIHNEPGVDLPDEVIRDYGDNRLIIAQEIFFSSPYFNNAKNLRYLGQMRSPLIDKQLYCNNCDTGFSIDKYMSCLYIDYPDGNVTLIYFADIEADGVKMIPDDPDLMMGLSYFIQAKFWEEKVYSHEANAIQLASQMHQQSSARLGAFQGRHRLKLINVSKHNQFMFRRNKMYNWNRN